eukprot:PhF_6_TR26183/c0_g1_i1/m.37220
MDPFAQYTTHKTSLLGLESTITNVLKTFSPSNALHSAILSAQHSVRGSLTDSNTMLSSLSKLVVCQTEAFVWGGKDIITEANLLLDEHRIMNEQGLLGDRAKYRPSWNDITKLTSTLSSLKSKGYISAKDIVLLDKVSNNLSKACFEARELQRITEALTTKLTEEMELFGLGQELAKYELVLNDLNPDVENCETLFEAAMLNGDVAVAEEIAYNQVALQERLLRLVEDQYPAIQHRQADAKEFRRQRRWAIFRTAGNDITGVVEGKNRHIDLCEEDIVKLAQTIKDHTASLHQRESQIDSDRVESNKFLETNENKQFAIFHKLDDLRNEVKQCEQDLLALQAERSHEIHRIIEMEENYATFRSRTHGFLSGAQKFMDRLQNTLENSRLARDLCGILQEFMLGGCSNIETKFEKADEHMSEMEAKVDKQFCKHATGYYLNVGRLLHKKQAKAKQLAEEIENARVQLEFCVDRLDPGAKRHAQQRQEYRQQKDLIDREIHRLQEKLETVNKKWDLVAVRLKARGVPFAHPEDVLNKATTLRQQRLLDMRDTLNITEDKIGHVLEKESTSIQQDREQLRVHLMDSQKAKKAALTVKAPRPPANAQQQAHSKSYQRYSQMVSDMNLHEISLAYPTSAAAINGGKTVKEMVLTTTNASQQQHQQSASPAARRASTHHVAPSMDPGALLGRTLVARYTYKSRAPDELTFVKGDMIVCVALGQEEGWFVGVSNQRTGLFPYNYVEVLPAESGEEFNLEI